MPAPKEHRPQMSAGEIAGLVAAFAFVLLVGVIAVPLLKLGRTVDELTATVQDIRREHVAKTSLTVDETNALLSTVNGQLTRVDVMAANAQAVTTNAAALSSTFATALGRPVIRVSAFSYAVREALAQRREAAATAAGAHSRRERTGTGR
jgi:uncharacterized protein YoxC